MVWREEKVSIKFFRDYISLYRLYTYISVFSVSILFLHTVACCPLCNSLYINGLRNWGCIKGDWSDEIRSPREKRTKARKSKRSYSMQWWLLPTLLYGCESWTVQKRQERRLQATEMRFLKIVEELTKLS